MINRMKRINNLTELLKTRPCSVQYIVKHLGVTERQVYRDIQVIKALDYPVTKFKHQYSINNGSKQTAL